ncbi:MAG: hypothetical protein PWQ37_313 [Candidatus Petromonas sp.]|nr:hypothetical protein [Candidatus Petromonas sp.]
MVVLADKNNSIIYKKSFDFAVAIVELYQYMCKTKHEYVLSKQLLRSGTSIAANIREGLEGQSKKDFIAKLSISLKEAAETEYWLELLIATNILTKNQVNDMLKEINEIIKILTKIINTSRKNI